MEKVISFKGDAEFFLKTFGFSPNIKDLLDKLGVGNRYGYVPLLEEHSLKLKNKNGFIAKVNREISNSIDSYHSLDELELLDEGYISINFVHDHSFVSKGIETNISSFVSLDVCVREYETKNIIKKSLNLDNNKFFSDNVMINL